MSNKHPFSFWQIWNMSFGFFGIQFGWGLQMANMSAIYQYLGADEGSLPLLWLAAPLTGLIVQPLIGYYSDRTWTRLGRRRPYFLVGAILASLSLIAMPNASTIWMAAGLLWILDASVNVSMEPFRAFVGDLLPREQRKSGFAMQSLLIGAGAVLSTALPWVLTNVFNIISHTDSANRIPITVHISFYAGSVLFFFAVVYTVLTTSENPPENMDEFLRKKKASEGISNAFREIYQGILAMPPTMRQLAVSQFFTWFGLFCMWIYFAPAVATKVFHGQPGSSAYQDGVEWGGLCFAFYNLTAFFFAFALLGLVKLYSAKSIHTICLICGGAGLISVSAISNSYGLLISMFGVGIAWASILSMPYAILSNAIPANRMGFFMGVFNFFIVLPQILASLVLGKIMTSLLGNNAMYAILIGGVSLIFAAISLRFVNTNDEEPVTEEPLATAH